MSSSDPPGAQTGPDPAGLSARSWDDVGIVALSVVAVAGSVVALVESDDQSTFAIAMFFVAVALALASLFLTVEARRRRALALAQLRRSVAETTVDMHRMIGRFERKDVDGGLIDDARTALVDARELRGLLGDERLDVAELATTAYELQDRFTSAAPPVRQQR